MGLFGHYIHPLHRRWGLARGWQGVGKPSKGRQGRAGVGGGHTNGTNGTPAGQQKRETKGGSREVCEGERVVDVFG